MTYTVNDKCIMCKHTDCVEVCPVDCFYEGENMLVINPDECIDCGVCEPECPADAIFQDSNLPDGEREKWELLNYKYSNEWPLISEARPDDVPQDAKEWDGVPNKYKEHFSSKPGRGD